MRKLSLTICFIAKPSKWRELKNEEIRVFGRGLFSLFNFALEISIPTSIKGNAEENLIVFLLAPFLITKVQVIASRINKFGKRPKHYQFGARIHSVPAAKKSESGGGIKFKSRGNSAQ